MFISRALLAASLIAAGVAAHAQVLNVWWEPSTTTAALGQTVNLSLYCNSSGPIVLDLSDAYMAIGWDSSKLLNTTASSIAEPAPWSQSYWSPGNPVNSSVVDGDAQRELLGQLPPSQPVAPVGVMHDAVNRLKVTSFSFKVTSTSPTSVKLWNAINGGSTHFFKGNFQIGEWALAYDHGTYSEAVINAVPEPVSLSVLGLGIAAMLRRRKKS